MSGEDILPELRKRESFCIRRRIVIATTLILIGYLATITILQAFIQLVAGTNQVVWNQSTSLLSNPPATHLVRAVAQRGSSYPLQSSSLAVTAVVPIQNQRRPKPGGIELLLRFLVQYPFVKEIIIWNDDVIKNGVDLNAEALLSRVNSTVDRRFLPILRVINSPGAMREMSSHMACSLAQFNTCYHADENKLNLNLDTLYTKYLESDGESNASIIQHASPEEYLKESPYNVFQPGHSLDSGVVSELSRGSLAAKHLSTRYFHQLSSAPFSNENSRLQSSIPNHAFNDIQFSVWSNRRPLKLVTSAQSTVLINSKTQEVNHLDAEFIHHTFRRLNQTIQDSDPFLVPALFPRPSTNLDEKSELEIGVASAYDDRSMLITNLDFPREWPLAIDGELSTCWNPSLSIPIPAMNHEIFVGLNFVQSVQLNKLTIFGNFDTNKWKLETYSAEERKWNSMSRLVPTIIQHHEPPSTKYVYDFLTKVSSSKVKKIRLILKPSSSPFELKSNQNSFSICGWMMNKDWVI